MIFALMISDFIVYIISYHLLHHDVYKGMAWWRAICVLWINIFLAAKQNFNRVVITDAAVMMIITTKIMIMTIMMTLNFYVLYIILMVNFFSWQQSTYFPACFLFLFLAALAELSMRLTTHNKHFWTAHQPWCGRLWRSQSNHSYLALCHIDFFF